MILNFTIQTVRNLTEYKVIFYKGRNRIHSYRNNIKMEIQSIFIHYKNNLFFKRSFK